VIDTLDTPLCAFASAFEKKSICGKACPQNKFYSKAVAFTVLTE
jgi:hypothetical protein